MSYPYLSDLVFAATGYALPLPFAVFGLFVAFATLAAAACFRSELRRLYAAKRIGAAQRRRRIDGAPAAPGVPPQDTVADLTLVVMLAGVAGARLFHILEHTDQFTAAPWDMIFSRSGLSVFGGLIFGTLAGLVCVRRWQLPVRPLLDAAAPAMMLGYAIGRIGCQVSGDGDWGIAADMALKPDWLPAWFWAQTYENNIFGAAIASPGVYPTPVYETALCLLCFLFLWKIRRHGQRDGWLFAVYLALAGAERLLVEQIRVNPAWDIAGLSATQAEIIAVVLIASGLLGTILLSGAGPQKQKAPAKAGASG